MAKKVSFSKPERPKQTTVDVDNWVASGSAEAATSESPKPQKGKKESARQKAATVVSEEEGFTRFTVDIPTGLHARIKAQCALRRVKMRDEIQTLLEKHFAS